MTQLIQIKQLQKSYGTRVIFNNASVSFLEGQKIGVIGRNGAGKSTLCRMIVGQEEPDDGQIVKHASLRLSYLEQGNPFKSGETVLEFLERYSGQPEWSCSKMANTFQLGDLLKNKIENLSGGYQTRVKLTGMLLTDPNFLILDEPTNYLDLRTLMLLENFLRDFKGSYLIVSHDREFLKKTCDNTLEVEEGDLKLFPGGIEQFMDYKNQQLEHALNFNKNVEQRRKQLQVFVDKFAAKTSKARQGQSKIKQIQKLELMVKEVPKQIKTVKITLPKIEQRKGVALIVDKLTIGYPDKVIARNITFEITMGSKVAILGDNGEGKTTFLRTIAGELPPIFGSFKWGHRLTIAYYAQHVYRSLAGDSSVKMQLMSMADKTVSEQEILDVAGSFLFSGKDVDKKISVLSGGEKARVCLAGMLLSKSSVLIFDEPTNHLDFDTVEALADALSKYDGTVFFTSHDRTFVRLLATDIIEVGGGRVVKYSGSYDDYIYALQQTLLSTEIDPTIFSKKEKKVEISIAEQKEQRKDLKNKIRDLEKKLKSLEKKKERLAKELAENWTVAMSKDFASVESELESVEIELLDGLEKIEAI
ncbi:MAG: ABC transporter related protein [candidate division TM6 bacterium GW2011_GWF2_32_72]|nr:MAG: ABC transporter related protein [candidate division TM6 bacterium GW2011_GWF2_32_72]